MSENKITLLHGDCMDYMRTLPDNAFDLAIVDPPYGDANFQIPPHQATNQDGGACSTDIKGQWNRFGGRFNRYKRASFDLSWEDLKSTVEITTPKIKMTQIKRRVSGGILHRKRNTSKNCSV